MTILASRRLRHWGNTKTPSRSWRGCWDTYSCTGNRSGGGGRRITNEDSKKNWVQDHRGRSVFYLDAPRSFPNFQVMAAAQLEE